MAMINGSDRIPKVGAVVTSVRVYMNADEDDLVEIEFMDSDAKAMDHGYVPKDNRKTMVSHITTDRDPLEKEILEKFVYPKDGIAGFAPDVEGKKVT